MAVPRGFLKMGTDDSTTRGTQRWPYAVGETEEAAFVFDYNVFGNEMRMTDDKALTCFGRTTLVRYNKKQSPRWGVLMNKSSIDDGQIRLPFSFPKNPACARYGAAAYASACIGGS